MNYVDLFKKGTLKNERDFENSVRRDLASSFPSDWLLIHPKTQDTFSGWPDMFIQLPDALVAVEFKVGRNQPTDLQINFKESFLKLGEKGFERAFFFIWPENFSELSLYLFSKRKKIYYKD